MAYLEFEIPTRSWSTSEKEILLAKMSQIGFEGFAESADMIQAYIEEGHYSGEDLNRVIDELESNGIHLQYHYHRTEDQNWNREWEKKFNPVLIDEKVLIRAPFHEASADPDLTLVIEPKMSFGTGHHHTTKLMIREMLKYNLKESSVLDMGCGTGVLGILACKLGAKRVLGVDNDQWAYENALENMQRNEAVGMEVTLGDAGTLGEEIFDFELANITRNILVRDLRKYCDHLRSKGVLIVSGFLAEDVQYVLNKAYQCGLNHINTQEQENWICLSFVKP